MWLVKKAGKITTSVHDSPRVHMIKCTADLDEILPDCSLGNLFLFSLEVLQKIYNLTELGHFYTGIHEHDR